MSINEQAFTWPSTFSCSLVRDKYIYPNQINISVSMLPNDSDHDAVRLGFKKLKHFVVSYLNNAIVINSNHPLLPVFKTFETTTIHLPTEPSDYIIANILFHKFSSILEDKIQITQITVDSHIGDSVKYTVNTGSISLSGDYWWNRNTVETNDEDSFPSWDEVKIQNTKFEPRVVIGGKNGNRQVW